ncbi:2-succinyl-5-enolpyruvyl-6-hydroxy-3-cyclohexene -1-carboxylate synthase [Sodalis praecaptivus]|uniref:2-succinyl-5-enolpyruvyl-6-hydroxy-3-cyclohexene-1-carboxylate synthase n=1 Tax=Sodalis praecaptivus TaxID=1239307 RepID=W0HRG7_9GAMM|nr:2-succinyl-5-enolpyruvyl-6-hydroxy-3-cyclohexene-1-carboxylic-acid synthase [Sodalis praecaptivus]AHF76416.1 2-succinyl-5-enolpyruvyl-6-hydroxy-3-cyclohexene -1-carboxylate synthase [Sodalis praecaptivus]
MSRIVFNRRWATLLLETLTRHGVGHVCIAPGSRSTPLTLAAAAHPRLTLHTHFDERGLGHLALGLAKASGQPVAVIVTSGTAAANLYPALIEASLTGERLVLLTADRPAELIDCGANQAIRQPGMFAGFAVRALDLPRPTPAIPARWLVSAVDALLDEVAHGGVHINCPFAEPLYGAQQEQADDWSQALGDWWQSEQPWLTAATSPVLRAEADWPDWRQRRGVVIAGRTGAAQGEAIARWARTLGWPLLGDVLSHTGQPLPHADLWLNASAAQEILARTELVVQFGSSLTGKRLLAWQADCPAQMLWLVDPLPGRRDPGHHRGRRIFADVAPWLARHPAVVNPPWAPALDDLAAAAARRVRQALLPAAAARSVVGVDPAYCAAGEGQRGAESVYPGASRGAIHAGSAGGAATASAAWETAPVCEARLAYGLPALLPAKGGVFLGNSLTVRLADALAQLPAGYPVWGNRGASGIDGLLATAAGVARATARPLLALLGDLSALYDVNSLALFRHCPAPVVILVVNNNGGQIFSLLPTPETVRQTYYVMPQQVDFRHAAALFGLDYQRPRDMGALRTALDTAWRRQPAAGAATLVELVVPAEQGASLLRELVAEMAR